MKALTQARLKELLHYNPDTGAFTWLIHRGGTAQVGSVAGRIDRDGYIEIKVDRERYAAHRLAWLYVHGSMPSYLIGHANRDRADNAFDNLQHLDRTKNQRTHAIGSRNRSGALGVSWIKAHKSWQAKIKVGGKSLHLGLFKDFGRAVFVRQYHEAINGLYVKHA